MTDLITRLRDADTTRRIGESYADTHERRQRDRDEAADRIEQLEAALRGVMQEAERHHAENITRAELGGSDMAQRKAKAIVSRSGVLLHSIKGIARAALAAPSGALEERT